jgi:hypothetical protein
MGWLNYTVVAERLLSSNKIPTSEVIISSIKKVNPTSQNLTDGEKDLGYELKGKLQNLLLENYGDSFVFAPHPFNQDIVLIKHKYLPSVDACHADIKQLSVKSFQSISDTDTNQIVEQKTIRKNKVQINTSESNDPSDLLKKAQVLLEEYDYDTSVDILSKIRVNDLDDILVLVKATRILLDEIGSYNAAICLIQSQPPLIFKDKNIRELLALTYSNNSMLPEARAVFESIQIHELSKESLYAYSSISYRDGNLSLAYKLLKNAEEKDGFIEAYSTLRDDIELGMRLEAEPELKSALEEFDKNDIPAARLFALSALEIYPHYSEARDLVSIIDAMNAEVETADLWRSLELASTGKDRLATLEKLIEVDRVNKSKIKQLIVKEKESIRNSIICDRVSRLSILADEANWENAFKELLWLLHQEVDLEAYKHVYTQTPVYSVFYNNRRLLRLSEQKVKDVWFSFINIYERFSAKQYDGYLDLLDEIKSYFQAYPVFSQIYREVKALEQQKSKSELNRLMALLNDVGCSIFDAEKIIIIARKHIQVLALNERAYFNTEIERRLEELKPRTPEEKLLEEYSNALLIGNNLKAEQLKDEIQNIDAVSKITAEITERYRIETVPITVTCSEKMDVDIVSESSGLEKIAVVGNCVLLQENSNSIILLNPVELKATRYVHDCFSNISYCDALLDSNIYLFRNSSQVAYKILLADDEARIISSFDINATLNINTDDDVYEMFISTERPGYIYFDSLFYYEKYGRKFRKFDIFKNLIKHEIVNDTSDDPRYTIFRLAYSPDKFVLEIDGDRSVYGKNLDKINKNISGFVVGYDPLTREVYAFDGDNLMAYDENLKETLNVAITSSNGWIYYEDVIGINVHKLIMLLRSNLGAEFYRSDNNVDSEPVCLSSLICTQTPSEFFYYKYDAAHNSIFIQNISNNIDNYVKWNEKTDTSEISEVEVDLEEPNLVDVENTLESENYF